MAAAAQQTKLFLYDDPHSEYCAKVKVALHYKQLHWQTLPVGPCGGSQDLQYTQRVPLRKIPALVVARVPENVTAAAPLPTLEDHGLAIAGKGQGPAEFILYESEVINEWLEEQFPQPPMLPADPWGRARARLVSRFHDLYLEPALRKLYPQVTPQTRDPAAVAAAGQEFIAHLKHLEQHLLLPGARFAVGNRLSLADCSYPGLLLYAIKIFPAVDLGDLNFADLGLPRVAEWHTALTAEPSVLKVLEELEPAAQQWLDTKLGQQTT